MREQLPADVVAQAALDGSQRPVPAAVVGIAFRLDGQSAELASARLSAMNLEHETSAGGSHWPLVL